MTWEEYKKTFQTEARWMKAIQHLRDSGELTNTVKDIGPIIKEIQADVKREEYEIIMEQLWQMYGRDLIKETTTHFPMFYKNYLEEESDGK